MSRSSIPLASKLISTTTGARIHTLEGGDTSGRLLICLHGLGGSSDTFIPLLDSLPQSRHIVLVDFPGFGKSPFSGANVSIANHVTDLRDVITSLQGTQGDPSGKIILIGHSLGAVVALHYAAQHPDAIECLALLGPGRAAGHIPAAKQRMLDLAACVRRDGMESAAETAAKSNFYEDTQERTASPEARQAVREAVAKSDPEAYAQTCEAMVNASHVDPEYRNIRCPTVFVAGDKDMISPVDRSRDLSGLCGGLSEVVVAKSGHQPILEDVESVKASLNWLFDRTETG